MVRVLKSQKEKTIDKLQFITDSMDQIRFQQILFKKDKTFLRKKIKCIDMMLERSMKIEDKQTSLTIPNLIAQKIFLEKQLEFVKNQLQTNYNIKRELFLYKKELIKKH